MFTSTLYFSAHTSNQDPLGPQVITAYKLLPVHSGILSKNKTYIQTNATETISFFLIISHSCANCRLVDTLDDTSEILL